MGFFALDDTKIEIVGEFFRVKGFFVVFHEVGNVGVAGYFG